MELQDGGSREMRTSGLSHLMLSVYRPNIFWGGGVNVSHEQCENVEYLYTVACSCCEKI